VLRKAAIRASESLADPSLVADITALTTDKDPTVILQVLHTAKRMKWKDHTRLINFTALSAGSPKGIKELAGQMLNNQISFPREFTNAQKDQMRRGQAIYQELCFTCHGLDGKGTEIAGLARRHDPRALARRIQDRRERRSPSSASSSTD
jgi:cytochrome c553